MASDLDELQKIRDKRLDQLRKQELELNSSRVQLFWEDSQRNPDNKKKFFRERRAVVVERVKLENAILEKIAGMLKELQDDLKEGCDELQSAIDNLNDEVDFFNKLSRVTGILARVLLFA